MADIKISGKLVNDTDDKLADGSQIMVDIGGSEKSLQSAIDDDDIGGGSELDEVLEKGSGTGSVKMKGTLAKGSNSFAEGYGTNAIGEASHAEGYKTVASGEYSHAEGDSTNAIGEASHAEGYASVASGEYSHAEGMSGEASGNYSHVEGTCSTASGIDAHAEGDSTTASGDASHTEGTNTTASGENSHSEGEQTDASGKCSHAEGSATTASGPQSHAEGGGSKATASCAHAEGGYTIAKGGYSHAEGTSTITIGNSSHAEGDGGVGQVVTSSAYSASSTQVGGVYTGSSNFDFVDAYVVSRDGSFCKKITSSEVHGSDTAFLFGSAIGVAIPNNTTLYIITGAEGTNSHAEGEKCRAIANNSHAEGQCTKTTNIGEHAEGRYNNSHTDTIHSVGIGSASTSKNAHEIMVDGTHYLGDGTIYNCQYGDSNKDSKKIVPVSLSEQTLTVGSSSIVIPSFAGAGGWDVYNTTSALYGIGFRPQTIGETVTQVGELDIVSTDGNRVFDLRAYSEPCQFDILIKDRTPFETVIYFKGIDTIDIGLKVSATISISDIIDVNDEPDIDTSKTYMVSIQYASIVWAEVTPRYNEEEETTDE